MEVEESPVHARSESTCDDLRLRSSKIGPKVEGFDGEPSAALKLCQWWRKALGAGVRKRREAALQTECQRRVRPRGGKVRLTAEYQYDGS